MNVQHLEYFVSLAQTEHMTQTAKELNTSQPNLSYMISELEKELGVPLFQKVGRNIRLTQYGRIFYKSAKQSLLNLQEAYEKIASINNPHQGTIKLGFIYTFGAERAPKLIQSFLDDFPDVHFNFEQNNSQNLLEKLDKESLDIAIVSKVERFDHIVFESLTNEKLVLVVPENHPLSAKDSLSLQQVKDEPFIYYNEHSGLRPYLDHSFAQFGLTPNVKLELEDDQSVLGFVASGFGIAIVPDIATISAYPVKKFAISDTLEERRIYLAYRKDRYLPPVCQSFLQYALEYFENR